MLALTMKGEAMIKTDTAVTHKDYLELTRGKSGTEKTQLMEWLTIAHIDSKSTHLPSDKNGLMVVEIPKKSLIEWGVVSESNLKSTIDRVHKEMQQLSVVIGDNKKGESSIIFPSISWDEDKIFVKILPSIAPYFLDLRGQFTQIHLSVLFRKLNTFWGRKIYSICRNHLHLDSDWALLSITFGELKSRLGLQDKYPDWKIFNRAVISPALKEINTSDTGLQITVSAERLSRFKNPNNLDKDSKAYKRLKKEHDESKVILFDIEAKTTPTSQLELGVSPSISSLTEYVHGYLTEIGFNNLQMIEALADKYGSDILERAVKQFEVANRSNPSKGKLPGLFHNRIERYIGYQTQQADDELIRSEGNLKHQTDLEQKRKREAALRQKEVKEWRLANPFEVWVENEKDGYASLPVKVPLPSDEEFKGVWSKYPID